MLILRSTGRFLTGASVLAISVLALPAAAQSIDTTTTSTAPSLEGQNEDGKRIFLPADFARFSPKTANDMVRQIPGFSIKEGDDDRRGLGQADQNVLINGQRISGKNNDAVTALGRIPAASVERIEIVDGATLSISGLSGQVLNVIAKGTGKISGSFEWRPQYRERIQNNYFPGEISINGKIGKADFSLALENDSFRGGGWGPEAITGPTGAILFRRDEIGTFYGDEPKVTAFLGRTADNGNILNLNTSFERVSFRGQVDTQRTQTGVANIRELFNRRENYTRFEASGDYEFALAGGRLKLIGLQRLENLPSFNRLVSTFADGRPSTGSRFDRVEDESETVLRAEYGWKTSGGTDWGISLEGALNSLKTVSGLVRLDSAGVFQPVANSGTNSTVKEKRAELIVTYGRPLSSNLTLQATLGGEYSELQGTTTRRFKRPKGSVSLAWNPKQGTDLSLKLERSVDQLDFSDFNARIDVANNVPNAANGSLVPPQIWRAEFEGTQTFGSFGSATVILFGEKITDIVDTIPIQTATGLIGGRGNLPNASRIGAEINATLLFDSLGWRGAKLDIEAEAERSRLRDPLTLQNRYISNDRIYRYELALRHDIPGSDWAWGGGIEDGRRASFFGFSNQATDFRDRAWSWVFVEHKDVLGMTVNFNVGNLLNRGEGFEQDFYDTSRAGNLTRNERRVRKFGRVIRLRIKGNF